MERLHLHIPWLLLLGAASALACRNASSWEESADEEVYDILAERRAELGVGDAFTIEPARDTLRQRLEAGETASLSLDLTRCLEVAAENSRDWQDEREALYRSALDLTLERWNFSLQESGTLAAFLAGTGSRSAENGFLSNLNLFKILGIGTAITVDAGIDFLKDAGSGSLDALSHLALNITQPILRGFGRDIVLEPLTQAERDVLYQARAYERFRRTFAVEVAERFFRVLEQVDRLKNEEANHTNLVKLRERNEAFAEAGRMTDIEVDQARQDEFSTQDRLVTARRDLEAALDDFKFQLGLPIEIPLTLVEGGLRSLEAWPGLSSPLDEATVIALGLERRLDHHTALDEVADAERAAKVAADALRLGLDLSASVAGTSDDVGRPATFEDEDFAWALRLDVDLPIDKIPERNAYRETLIEREAAKRAAQESADGITSGLRDSLRSLEAAQASYEIQSGSVALAERRVESAVLNLEAGRASTRDVLEAQEDLLQAQNDLAAALTDILLAGLFLYRDMELLDVTEEGVRLLPLPGSPEPKP